MELKNKPLITAVYILLEKGGKILMIRRYNTGFSDGQYSLVAGHVEKGESFKSAAVRELHEEVGISINEKDFELSHTMFRSLKSEERIDLFFNVNKWNGEAVNKEPSKCDDLIWVESNKLPKNTLDYVAHAIACMKNDIQTSKWKNYNS